MQLLLRLPYRVRVAVVRVPELLQGVRGVQAANGLVRLLQLSAGCGSFLSQGIEALTAVLQRLLHGERGAGQRLHDGVRPRLFLRGQAGLGGQCLKLRHQRVHVVAVAGDGLDRAAVVHLLRLAALGDGADDHGGDGSEQADDGDDRADHAAAGHGGDTAARSERRVHGLDGGDGLVDHGDQADDARRDDGDDEVPSAQRVGARGDDLHKTGHALVELLHPLGVQQGVELLHSGGQAVLGGGDGFLPDGVLLRGRARSAHRAGIQFIGAAAAFNALGHIGHQGDEVVLLAGTGHGGGDIGLLLAREGVPLCGDVGEDVRHVAPVALAVHERHVDGAQGFGDVVDPGGVLLVEALRLDGVQAGHDGVDGRADDLGRLPRLLTDGGDVRAQPLKREAKFLCGSGCLLHGHADLIGAGGAHVAQVGEDVGGVLGADAHGVGGGGDDLRGIVELHGRDLGVLGGGDQALVDLLFIQALPPELRSGHGDLRGRDLHVPGELAIADAQLVGLRLGLARNDADLVQLVVVGLGEAGGVAPKGGQPAQHQHGRRHLEQAAGDVIQGILEGGGVFTHAAHAALVRGFSVARLGDEVEYLLADILLDGEGANLLLDAADFLEGLLRALAPVGFARFVAASDRNVVLAIGVGQLLVGHLHLLELPRPGTVQLALCRGAVLLRGERAVVLLLGGGLLMREVNQPGAGDSLLI